MFDNPQYQVSHPSPTTTTHPHPSVNTGLRGLGCFRPIIEPRHHEEAESDDDCGWEEGGDDEEAGGSGAGAGGVPRGPVQQPLTVCSVQDAAFFKLEVTNLRADFGLGRERGFFPGSAAPEYVAVQCPMSYEDPYRDLRRPAYNTQVGRLDGAFDPSQDAHPVRP